MKNINAAEFGFIPGNSGEKNAEALNKAVKHGEKITVDVRGVYDISGTVMLPSNTHLEFKPGTIIRRVAFADGRNQGNLFINEGAYNGRYNENITLSGLHIVTNGVESAGASSENQNIIPGLRGHIAFLYIKNLLIEDIVINDLGAKDYAIQISDFENAEVRHIHIEGLKDGVHFGPGKNFAVRDSSFRTFDDAIALNASDYSISNPNIGTISDGIIENCTELPGDFTDAFFLRILVGTARKWKKGMTVYHSDAIKTRNGMYRVIMHPDNTAYVSVTEPCFEEGYKELDGIMWIKTHKGYAPDEISMTAGCKNIVCRNICLEKNRNHAVLIYASFDEYLRSYYAGSEIPEVKNITFDNVNILSKIKHFLFVNTKAENVSVINSTPNADIYEEPNLQQNIN